METEAKVDREPGYLRLDGSIESLSTIINALKDLKEKIDLSPTEQKLENLAEPTPQRSLHGILENGPGRINTKIEECLKQINEIVELLF